jgi:hypothetical protein
MRRYLIHLIASVLLLVGWITGAELLAAEEQRKRPTREEPSEAALEAKLDLLLQQQEEILKKMDQVLEELKIVKIRATLR